MPLFVSDRERRLWLWVALIVLAIYATLGLASSVADWLYGQGLMTAAFIASMLLVLVTIVLVALKTRAHGLEIGVGLGIAVVYFLVLLRLAIPERSHLMEYGVLAVFVYEALLERSMQGRRVPYPALLGVLITALIGAVDEGIQLFLPNRVFDWRDMLFNLLAAVMAVVAMLVLRWVRGRVRREKA